MTQARSGSAAAPSEETVLTRAVLRATEQLGLTSRTLAGVLGVSEATVSRMRGGGYVLQRGQKAFDLAILLVRLFRSLDAITGGDETVARAWLKNHNTALDGRPVALIETIPGLWHVIEYLDARRAIL
ncbi:MbcA/ParS/Xre antitoxin family protein [Geminicoccaceae bacterium 1502E]|nr:MbcA/ParS/Xre antitoxin family protein [Geminicoccaceae bacterium 1502E]